MLIVYHDIKSIIEVVNTTNNFSVKATKTKPLEELFSLASIYENEILIWCHIDLKAVLNLNVIECCFHNKNTMISFSNTTYFNDAIGCVEDTIFMKINKKVKYPTWLMSSNCGAIHSSVLKLFKNSVTPKANFSYNLNSIAKLGMANGLMCYSLPNIVNENIDIIEEKSSIYKLFQFVKQHYRARWVSLLFLNLLFFQSKVVVLPLLKSCFYKRRSFKKLLNVDIVNSNLSKPKPSVAVLIPTIGRANYLINVLKDLSLQTLLPKEVIIVEQNDNKPLETELSYLKTEEWPFKIKHELIAQTGACNARNIGLNLISSDYVFFADDDIRFNEKTIETSIVFMLKNKINATTVSCLRENEKENREALLQWVSFGSGCSFVKASEVDNLRFNMAYEHGFGEDSDYGMQLRNKGVDIIYLPTVKLLHLKAPVGGFRKKHVFKWETEKQQPKPSPTVMLFKLKNNTKTQLYSYKLTLFFKFYKTQKIKNPFKYLTFFKASWNQSLNWANKIDRTNS